MKQAYVEVFFDCRVCERHGWVCGRWKDVVLTAHNDDIWSMAATYDTFQYHSIIV